MSRNALRRLETSSSKQRTVKRFVLLNHGLRTLKLSLRLTFSALISVKLKHSPLRRKTRVCL